MRYSLRTLLIVMALGPPAVWWLVDRPWRDASRVPLGLDGYCPVTVVQSSKWQTGEPKVSAIFEDRLYLFANADALSVFEHDPERFAPVRRGEDVVRWIEQRKKSAGDRRYGLISNQDQRMYLFDSPETRNLFEANPRKYITAMKTH
jgi:YHS domain-containing protein